MSPSPQTISSKSSDVFKKTMHSKYVLEISSWFSDFSEDKSIHPTSRLRLSELVRMARRRKRNRKFRDDKNFRKGVLHDSVVKKVCRREEEVRDDNGDSRCLRIQRSPAKQQKTNTTDSYEPLDIESFCQRLDAKML
ncbi:hypothetical protein L5515_018712 [Caenorhabditis briggsae]|uniref:Uncharacterized protein n=1 Tax=Caenorhabditis briggsae TaxID=6238 RepID=A0AAE9FIT0_CAEBR|nr:hypothetical protein L5515_018712 [Caenorhabditis briggsae]